MRNLICRSAVALMMMLWMVSPFLAAAQTLQPNYGAPTLPVSVCNDNAVFKVKIIGSSSACASATLDIQLPAGYRYISNSASVTAGSGTLSQVSVTGNVARLTVNNIPASPDSTVISYTANADCSTIGTATASNSSARYTLASPCLGSYVVTSNTFNTQSAALSFTNISNANYAGVIGDSYARAITITNNGLGTVSSITLRDTSGNGLYISSFAANNGWTVTSTKTVAGTDTIHVYELQGPSLQQGQQVVLTQQIRVVNACYLQSRLYAFFGCFGSACTNNNVSATASAGATVNSSLAPNLRVTPTMTALACRGVDYLQQIAFANIGTAPLYNLRINLFSSTWSAVAATQYFNPARSSNAGGQSGYSNIEYRIGTTGAWAPLVPTSTASFTTPGAAIAGLPSSFVYTIPVINNGETFYLRYNERNSPLTAVNAGNTMEVSGGELRYQYSNGCGGNTTEVAQFVRNYQQLRVNTQTDLPGNIETGNLYDFSYTFTESNTGIYTYTGATGSYIRYSLALPARIVFTGALADISMTKNGANYGTPTNYSYNTTTNTISVTYPVTSSFNVNGQQGATLTFGKMSLNCAAASTANTVALSTYLKAQSGCSNEELFSVNNTSVGLVCPVDCGTTGGVSFNGYRLQRTNYGQPDNDNNGAADATGSLNMGLVNRNYAMVGDTIENLYQGRIATGSGTPAAGFRFGYIENTFSAYTANISNLFARITVYNAAGDSIYGCNNLPITTTGSIRKVDFSIATLNATTGCAPFPQTQFNNGDSVVVRVYYRIGTNPGGVLAPVTITNAFYVSAVANPAAAARYSCGGRYTGNLVLVGWGAGSGTGNLTYSITTRDSARTQASNVSYLGPCCVTAGAKPFGYEYRSVTIYDSMSYDLPAGYDFSSATISYSYTTGPSRSASQTVNIYPTGQTGNTLIFNIRQLFESGALRYSDQGSSMTATVNIKPNCAAPAKSVARFFIRQVARPGSTFGNLTYNTTLFDTIYLTAPLLSASAANSNSIANSNTTSWEVQIGNASTTTATGVWMGKDTGTTGMNITSVQRLSGPGGTVVGTINPSGLGIYQLGDFAQTSQYYRVTASFTSCNKDSMKLAYWYDCNRSGYPSTVAAQPYRKNITLQVTPQQAALQLAITQQPDPGTPPNLCDTLWYTLEVLNAGPGEASGLRVNAYLPAGGGMNYVPGTYTLRYPSAGSAIAIADGQVSSAGSIISFTIPAAQVSRLVANDRLVIRFGLQTSCGFSSGQTLRFAPMGQSPCGAISTGIIQQTEKLNMAGVPATLNVYALYSQAAPAAQACDTSNGIESLYRFKIINQGPLPTSTADVYNVELPAPWTLDTSTVAFLHNPSGARFDRFSNGGWYFRTGAGLAVGDSVVMTAVLRAAAPASAAIPAGPTNLITEHALVEYNGFCSTTGTYCPTSRVIVATNETTAIDVEPVQYSITGMSLQAYTSKDTSISGSITLTRNNNLYTPHRVNIHLYKDLNNDGVVDGGDLHLGVQNMPVADSTVQTLYFNLNSPYDGALCPQVIARAEIACTNLDYVFNCSSAAVYHSVMSTPQRISHCEDVYFKVIGVEDFGKWVVDSGHATITTPNIHRTSVLVQQGLGARLIWIAQAPAANGSTLIIADTVRLFNDAKPYFDTPLEDLTVCVGSPATFYPDVHLDYAVPTFQWYKDGVLLPGVTDQNYTISNAAQLSDAGLYTLKIFGNRGCDSTGDVRLTVIPMPTATINYEETYCRTGTATPQRTGQTGGVFSATGGLVINASTGVIDLAASATGVYTIKYAFSNGQCVDSVKDEIQIFGIPQLVTHAPARVCAGITIDLTEPAVTSGSDANLVFSYYTDAAGTQPVSNPAAVATGGTYYIRGTLPITGCQTPLLPVQVTITPFEVQLQADKNPVLAGTPVNLSTSANFDYQVLSWSPASDFADQTATTQHVTLAGDDRLIKVIAQSTQGCIDSVTLDLQLDPNTQDFFIPNVFTPNSDGKNDIFRVYGSSIKTMELRVYNQWGNLMWETRDYMKGWDGRFHGQDQPAGAYVYTVKAVLYSGQEIVRRGTITLIR